MKGADHGAATPPRRLRPARPAPQAGVKETDACETITRRSRRRLLAPLSFCARREEPERRGRFGATPAPPGSGAALRDVMPYAERAPSPAARNPSKTSNDQIAAL